MQSVGIKSLKDRLSEYLRAVAAGETVLVTDRGRVVAELGPPRAPSGASPAEQRLAELVRQGLIAPAKNPARARLPRRKPAAPLADLLRELDASRADR
jgi:antitoxin (DNA-binding transcriptional repressor) of toxin-antitoxin stability system